MKVSARDFGIKLQRSIADLAPYLRTRRIWISFALAFVLLCTAIVVVALPNDRGDFLLYEQNIEVISYENGLNILTDGTLLERLDTASQCQQFRSSMDGSVAAFLTEDQVLYLVEGQRVKKIAVDVQQFELSTTGEGLAYAQEAGDQCFLTLYNVPKRSSREITEHLTRMDFSLSPDGSNVAYYELRQGKEVLAVNRKEKRHTVTSEATDLIGISNDGKQIYAICSKARDHSILCSFHYRGQKQELGGISSISFKFNSDHRQIMYYSGGQTYISTNGQEGILVSSYPLYLVTAPNSQSTKDTNAITYPVRSLFDHVYTCFDGESNSAWLIKKNPDKSIKLVSKVSGCTLDASNKYLYYLHEMKQLRYIRLRDGKDAAEHFQVLADNVDSYALTANRKLAYFTSNSSLCTVSGKSGGTVKILCENTDSLTPVLNRGDWVYYLSEGQLYASKNGRSGTVVAENIRSLYSSSNSVVYALGEEALYTSTTKKQLNQVNPS